VVKNEAAATKEFGQERGIILNLDLDWRDHPLLGGVQLCRSADERVDEDDQA
jgi:hypothetical protein